MACWRHANIVEGVPHVMEFFKDEIIIHGQSGAASRRGRRDGPLLHGSGCFSAGVLSFFVILLGDHLHPRLVDSLPTAVASRVSRNRQDAVAQRRGGAATGRRAGLGRYPIY